MPTGNGRPPSYYMENFIPLPGLFPILAFSHTAMAEAAINLGFLAATTLAIGRDVYGRLPSYPTTSGKRFRGEPGATPLMDEVCDPAALPPRTSRGPSLAPAARRAVKACCESLLEAKYIQESVSGTVPSVATTPRVTCLNDLGQGTTATTRVGNKIICKGIQIEGILALPIDAASDVYRLVLVIDHECFGSACTWAQYVQGTSSNAVYSLPSMETVGKGKRFTTLVDRLIPINNTVGPTHGPLFQSFSIKVPLNFSAMYSGNAGTISDIVRNSLCLIEGSSAGNVTSYWQAQLVFLDG